MVIILIVTMALVTYAIIGSLPGHRHLSRDKIESIMEEMQCEE